MNIRLEDRLTFEEVYPKSTYAELIRLALALAASLRGGTQEEKASGVIEFPKRREVGRLAPT
jgi:hypothetical protein